MEIDLTTLEAPEVFQLLVTTIFPRPIAWVATMAESNVPHLAAFTFFQVVTPNPPMVMFVPLDPQGAVEGRTVSNLREVPEFTVSLLSHALTERYGSLPGETTPRFSGSGIRPEASAGVRPPRIADAAVSFECAVSAIVPIGADPLAVPVVFGRIKAAHVDDSVRAADRSIDPSLLDFLGAMGPGTVASTRDRFVLDRQR